MFLFMLRITYNKDTKSLFIIIKTPCRSRASFYFLFSLHHPEHLLGHGLFVRGLLHLGSRSVQFLKPYHLVLGIFQSQMCVYVHRHADIRMPHQVLQGLWVHPGFRHVAAVGVTAYMGSDFRHLTWYLNWYRPPLRCDSPTLRFLFLLTRLLFGLPVCAILHS